MKITGAARGLHIAIMSSLALAVTACQQPVSTEADPPMNSTANFQLESAAFADGAAIPKKHTGEGLDLSPPLAWKNAPAATKQYAIICDDPDAPSRDPWVHWVIYGIAGNTTSLPEGILPAANLATPPGAKQGPNSWSSGRTLGYRGPMPPPGHGPHHYHFKLYALDAELPLGPQLSKDELLGQIQAHILGQIELVGTYQRK